jgi:hypothetical protein
MVVEELELLVVGAVFGFTCFVTNRSVYACCVEASASASGRSRCQTPLLGLAGPAGEKLARLLYVV